MAMAGSTNGIIHVLAMARRAGVNLTLDDFEKLSNEVGVIANLRPSGEYLMEDFHYAGGFNAFFKTLLPHLKRDELTVTGKTIGGELSPRPRCGTRTSSVRSTSPSPRAAASPCCAATSRPTAASSSRPPPSRAC